MSNRLDYYYRQKVTEAELDLGFAQLEQADQNLAADLGFTGVIAGAVVSPHSVPNLTVDVSGPGAILDQVGQRIFFSAPQNVNVAVDQNGVSTNVSTAGNSKIVSVFVIFDRALSDPRVDGNSLSVFFHRDESFKFIVVQGSEAVSPSPPQPPPNAILLADITRRSGQNTVVTTDISIARRQDAFVISDSLHSIRGGRPIDAITQLLSLFNAHVGGTADKHPAASIDYAGGNSWADSTANSGPVTVEAQLDKIITDLGGLSGGLKIGAAASTGNPTPNSFVNGSVKSQLDALLNFLNTHLNNPSGAHAASAISMTATTNLQAGTVQQGLATLDSTSVRTNVANVFTAAQTLNGASGDTNAALITIATPTSRKLLWEINNGGSNSAIRFYSKGSGLEITLNARWDGTQWVKDVTGSAGFSFMIEVLNDSIKFRSTDNNNVSPFAQSAWDSSVVALGVQGHGSQSFDSGGNWTSAGATEAYAGFSGQSNSLNTSVGTGVTFRKSFPATPSSVTFTVLSSSNLNGSLSDTMSLRTANGTGVFAGTLGTTNGSSFFARVFAS